MYFGANPVSWNDLDDTFWAGSTPIFALLPRSIMFTSFCTSPNATSPQHVAKQFDIFKNRNAKRLQYVSKFAAIFADVDEICLNNVSKIF